MNTKQLQDKLSVLAIKMRVLIIDNMAGTGDTESTCQQLALINRLNELERTINVIEGGDMEPRQ